LTGVAEGDCSFELVKVENELADAAAFRRAKGANDGPPKPDNPSESSKFQKDVTT
jgi:hypothetical protein